MRHHDSPSTSSVGSRLLVSHTAIAWVVTKASALQPLSPVVHLKAYWEEKAMELTLGGSAAGIEDVRAVRPDTFVRRLFRWTIENEDIGRLPLTENLSDHTQLTRMPSWNPVGCKYTIRTLFTTDGRLVPILDWCGTHFGTSGRSGWSTLPRRHPVLCPDETIIASVSHLDALRFLTQSPLSSIPSNVLYCASGLFFHHLFHESPFRQPLTAF